MRIISGTHKGRKIDPPSNLPVRPTTDYAKTGLFNILNNYFDFANLSILDLFSGTGNISFEFASRGVKEITSVDASSRCIQFIKETSEKLQFENIKTIRRDIFEFLESCENSFDIIFADPPYDMKGIENIPELIFEKKLLNENGWFILEHSGKINFSEYPNFFDKRLYGDVNFSFFK